MLSLLRANYLKSFVVRTVFQRSSFTKPTYNTLYS